MDDEKINTNPTQSQINIDSPASNELKNSVSETKPKKSKKTSSAQKPKETNDTKVKPLSSTDETPSAAQSDAEEKIIDAPALDSLIIDDGVIEKDVSEEQTGGFDEFLSDYKSVIKNTLRAAKSAFKGTSDEADDIQNSVQEPTNALTEELQEEGEVPQFALKIGDEVLPQSEFADIDIDKKSDDAYNPAKPRIIDSIFDFIELFIFTLAAVLVLTTFFFKHAVVDGDSMLNTLHDSEHLIVSDLFYSPKRGDIIVFQDTDLFPNGPVVKRVIGLPGETVEVKLNKNGEYEVYINGKYLDEDYDYTYPRGNPTLGGPWVIGEDEVFVMGDNRHNSTDSRAVGPIKIDTILGKVLFRIYPFDKFGTVD